MRSAEFDEFRAAFVRLCEDLDRRLTDELVESYWRALAEAKLPEVVGNIDRILRTATRDTKFPRPAELRSEMRNEAAPASVAGLEAAKARCADHWRALQREDPELYRLEYAIAQAGVILATSHAGSVEHAEALREDRVARDARYGLWCRRAAAKKAAAGKEAA